MVTFGGDDGDDGEGTPIINELRERDQLSACLNRNKNKIEIFY